MTREDIIRMAEESGLAEVLSKYDGEYGHDNSEETEGFSELERFAALVAAAERGAILKLADSLGYVDVDAIRARNTQEQPR